MRIEEVDGLCEHAGALFWPIAIEKVGKSRKVRGFELAIQHLEDSPVSYNYDGHQRTVPARNLTQRTEMHFLGLGFVDFSDCESPEAVVQRLHEVREQSVELRARNIRARKESKRIAIRLPGIRLRAGGGAGIEGSDQAIACILRHLIVPSSLEDLVVELQEIQDSYRFRPQKKES